jgi:DNA-binding transcriptional MerR regulator
VLGPSRVDQASGYRYYDTAQLGQARLVVMLRQLRFPLAAVKELPACDPRPNAHAIT